VQHYFDLIAWGIGNEGGPCNAMLCELCQVRFRGENRSVLNRGPSDAAWDRGQPVFGGGLEFLRVVLAWLV